MKFARESPYPEPGLTAELVAADIWKRLEQTDWGVGGATLRLAGLRLWETPDSSVELVP